MSIYSVESRLTARLLAARGSFILALFFLALTLSMVLIRGSAAKSTVNAVATVSAANFEADSPVAPDSIVAMFGVDLATSVEIGGTIPLPRNLLGTTVTIKDSAGIDRQAGLLFVSPQQINCVIPTGTASGLANISIVAGNGTMSAGTVEIASSAPGIFTASADGDGVPAAYVLHYLPDQSFTSANAFQGLPGNYQPLPIDLGPAGDQVFLVLFGTGIRGNPESVRVLIGGLELIPSYAGPQLAFEGLDQVNVLIDRELIGSGQIEVSLASLGFGDSNIVDVNIATPDGPQPPTVTGLSGPTSVLARDLITINGTKFAPILAGNTVRIGGIDAGIEAASPTQLQVRVQFGTPTGPITIGTSGGQWTSPNAQPVRTSMSGVVLDTDSQPLPGGATVSLIAGVPSVMTNPEGWFVLPDVPGAPPPGPGLTLAYKIVHPSFAPNPLKMPVIAQRDNHAGSVTYLQEAGGAETIIGGGPSFSGGATTSRAREAAADVTISIAGISLILPEALTAVFPSGGTTGAIALDVIKDSLTPVPMPPAIFSSSVAQITPFGVKLDPGARLIFPNPDGFPGNAQLKLYKFDLTVGSPTLGTFIDTGKIATVAANGASIQTELNAVTETSLYFVALPRPMTTITGRVVDSDGETPRRGAIVRARGQETRTDGNGGFVLRRVPVIAGLPIPVSASYLRPGGRVDRAFKLSPPAQVKALTRVGDLVLSSATSNRPPLIYVKQYLELYAGGTLTIPAMVMDLDEVLTEAVFTGPSFAQFTKTAVSGAYQLRIQPSAAQAGTYALAISATDTGGLTTRREMTLVVKPLPVANAQSLQTSEDQAVLIALSGTDADNLPLTYKLKSGPQNGALSGVAPNITYTPGLNFNGQDSFTFSVHNGLVESAPATISIAVLPVNDPPVIVVPGQQSVSANSLITFGVAASDADANQTLTLTATNLPAGAQFNQTQPGTPGPATGTFTWTPTAVQIGTHIVSFTATDSASPALSNTKTVTITVASQGVWRPTAGPDGGTITAFANLGGNVILAGTAGNGIFRSTNNGTSWLSSGLINQFITGFASIPGPGSALFAGTGSGVYRSLDGGLSWTSFSNGLTNTDVRALTVAAGILYAGTEGGGVFRLSNVSNTWSAVNSGITSLSISALTSIGEVVYAANAAGVFQLLGNWVPFSTGLPASRVIAFALRSTLGGTVLLAGTQGAGVYQRLAGGGNWSSLNLGLGNAVVNAIAVGPGDLVVFAGTTGGGVFRFDFGAQAPSWAAANAGLTNPVVRSLLATAQGGFAGTNEGGIFRTLDGGNTWSPANNGIPRARVSYLLSNAGALYAATIGGGIHTSSNNGNSWTGINNGLGSLTVSSLATIGGNLLASTVGAGIYRSLNGGALWSPVNSGLGNLSVQSLGVNGTAVFAGTDAGTVFVSTNQGGSWSPASTGLGGSAVYALFANGGFVFAGTNGGGIYRSSNNGGNWSPANNGLGSLRVSSFAAVGGAVFAGTLEGGVYRSTDNGATWSPVNNGLSSTDIYTLLVSGNRLFAGSNGGGVFVSSDVGNSWSALNQGLAFPFVLTLAGNGTFVFAGTDGGGVFILE